MEMHNVYKINIWRMLFHFSKLYFTVIKVLIVEVREISRSVAYKNVNIMQGWRSPR